MADIHTLVPGRRYCVVREFLDYDGRPHPVGETWQLATTNFVPYHDGLTLHVLVHNLPLTYRFQALPEAQAAILEHFTDYVQPC